MPDVSNERLDLLERRVNDLEVEVAQLRRIPPPPVGVPDPQPPRLWMPPAPTAAAKPVVDSEAVLKWGGIGLVVLAVGFALSTAISRGWIGPHLQLVGAVGLGAALLWAAFRTQRQRPLWTHALATGAVLVWCTTFASSLFHDLAGTTAALLASAAVVLVGHGVSKILNSEWAAGAAILGTIGSGLALDVVNRTSPIGLAWALLVAVPAVVIALDRGWVVTRFAGLVVPAFFIAAVAGESATRTDFVLIGAAAAFVSAIAFGVPSIGAPTSVWRQAEIQATNLLGPWLLVVTGAGLNLDDSRQWAVASFAIAAMIVGIALLARPRLLAAHFISLLIGASVVVSLGIATAFSWEATILGLAVQGAGLIVFRRALDNSVRVLVNALLLLGLSAAWVGGLMAFSWVNDAALADDLLHLAVIGAIGVGIWLMSGREFQAVGAIVCLALVMTWLGSVLVHWPQGQAIVSLAWASIGVGLLIGGALVARPHVGVAGLTVLAITVAKLLTVDLAAVDTLWRAGLFMVVGLALLRLGFSLPQLMGVAKEAEATSEP
ncbi:MAG: DUF2339 domain-containing protein [Acidimicrobiales bacterium]